MIANGAPRTNHIAAKVAEVLPLTGLAYVVDESAGETWAVTRTTPGLGLEQLAPGQKLDLTVVHYEEFSVVSAYAALE